MANTLVGAVIHIDEKRFPILRQRIVVHRIAMILRGDEAAFRTHHAHRLIMTAMSVFQLVYLGSSGFGEQLVAHTDTEDRQLFVLHRLADILYGGITGVGIAGSIGDEQAIEHQPVEIVIPRNANDLHIPFQQTTDNVGLDTAVHKNNLFE